MTRKATALRIVASKTSGPDLEAMERVLGESTRSMAPMISRASSTRGKMKAELAVLEADMEALNARRNLFRTQMDAVMVAFDRDEADIMEAITAFRNGLGLNDVPEGQ